MPEWVVGKISEALNANNKSVNNSSILILGIAYKKNVGDMRETPATRVMELLIEKGATVNYSDPHVPVFPRMRKYLFDMKSEEISESSLSEKDCVVIITDHDHFDWEFIYENSNLIVDTRGIYKEKRTKLVMA